MSSLFLKTIIADFYSINTINEFKVFFERIDIMIMIILCIRLRNIKLWTKLWSLIYKMHKKDNYLEFLDIMHDKNINNLSEFLSYMDNIFYKLISGKGLPFNKNDDLSVVFSNKSLDKLICFCDTLGIHSGKGVKDFTIETCKDAIYFYRSTKHNKLYEQIKFNNTMKKACISLLFYLEENNLGNY